jgi:hypothetical protein
MMPFYQQLGLGISWEQWDHQRHGGIAPDAHIVHKEPAHQLQ